MSILECGSKGSALGLDLQHINSLCYFETQSLTDLGHSEFLCWLSSKPQEFSVSETPNVPEVLSKNIQRNFLNIEKKTLNADLTLRLHQRNIPDPGP